VDDIPDDAPRSEDGYWWWDGEQWQAIPAPATEALARVLAEEGIPAAPGAIEEPATVARVVSALSDWYDGLDDINRAVVDSLTADGMSHLLITSEVGVLAEGGGFLAALDATGEPLGVSLNAAMTALARLEE
jgi:hypothetical protein